MLNLYLDPFVFVCPNPADGAGEFDCYIDTLVLLEDIRQSDWIHVYMMASTNEVLLSTDSYPMWDSLEKAIAYHNASEIQTRDVMTVINSLLQRVPQIEDAFQISEILVEEIQYQPNYHVQNRATPFIEHYLRILSLACLICEINGMDQREQVFITKSLRGATEQLIIHGKLVAHEPNRLALHIDLPHMFGGSFSGIVDRHGLFLCVDPILLWLNAHCPECYRQAISIYLFKRLLERGISALMAAPPWTVGLNFFASIDALSILRQENRIKELLRACVESILSENLSATHALRIGAGPNEPQRIRRRDGAKAFRRDINYDYHLHYWETSAGPEFAAVVTHNDMTIPE